MTAAVPLSVVPAKTGRPSKRTPETEARILAAIEAGCTREVAAEAAGISRDTLHSWARDFPYFSDALTRADAMCGVRCVQEIHRASHRDWRAAAWLLERRHPEDWGRRRLRIEAEIKPVTTTDYSDANERIERLIQQRIQQGTAAALASRDERPDDPEPYPADIPEGPYLTG